MGSGFESQGAHIKENPADSSESAGFLRSLNFMVLLARGAYYPLCSCRGPVLAELGHPDVAAEDICTSACIGIRGTLRSRRGCGRCAVVPCVRPVPSELWRGGLSRFSALLDGWMFCVWGGGGLSPFSVLLVGKSGARRGVGAVRSDIRVPEAKRGRAPPLKPATCQTQGTRKPATVTQQQRAIISKSLYYRTGQIRVTNSRKSSTSLPCSSRPTPKRVATSALSSNDK